jgi:hypothetical protein
MCHNPEDLDLKHLKMEATWASYTTLHGVTTQRTSTENITAVKASKLAPNLFVNVRVNTKQLKMLSLRSGIHH